MKQRKIILLGLGMGALMALKQPVFADDATTTAPPAGGTTNAPVVGMRGRGGRAGTNRFEQLALALGLTPDQKDKIKPLFFDEGTQMRALRRDQSLTTDQRMAKARAIQDTTVKQIDALLTPDQQTKYQTWLNDRKAKRQEAKAAPAAPAAAAPVNP